jgi:hypothetical protein
MDTTTIHAKEAEQKALADQALADFAAKEGIALEPVSAAESGESAKGAEAPLKSMGPVKTEQS